MSASDFGLLLGPPGLHVVAGLAMGAGLLWLYRWMHARFPPGAYIFAAGLLLRAFLGIALFWISWLNLPFLSDMHYGNGFWQLAPDAMGYMVRAARAAEYGLDTIRPGSASPAYVLAVALWMRLVGISPLSGMYLNLAVYCLLCALLVVLWRPKNEWRADLPLLVLLGAFSFSPVQVIHGSQSLKDDVFAFMISMGAVGALVIAMTTIHGMRAVHRWWALPAGGAAWLVAVFYAAGIRAYFAFFMLCSLAAVLGVFGLRPRWDAVYRRLPVALVVCVVTGWVYIAGAGPYDNYLRVVIGVFREAPRTDAAGTGLVPLVMSRIDAARRGFASSGGGTNLVRPELPPPAIAAGPAELPPPVAGEVAPAASASDPAAPAPDPAARMTAAERRRAIERSARAGSFHSRLALGLATLLIPISLLQALSITSLTGGRGLLFVTDVDTLFVDLTILASLGLLYWRWDVARRRLPFVCFLLLLGTVTALLLAYVVTNFGTQFRLRMLAVVPFWLLLLATSENPLMPAAPDEPRASAPALPDTSG